MTFSTQAQEVKLVEKLTDGSYVVSIDSIEYRAITGDKAVELAKNKIDLAACRENEKRFTDLIEIHKRDVVIANQKAEINETNFRHAMQLFETERGLRQEAQQFIPHGKVGGFGGKVLDFLDSPWMQGFWKMGVPAFSAWRTTKR